MISPTSPKLAYLKRRWKPIAAWIIVMYPTIKVAELFVGDSWKAYGGLVAFYVGAQAAEIAAIVAGRTKK